MNKYLVVLQVSNCYSGSMPQDGFVAIQVSSDDSIPAIAKARREIYHEYGGNNELISIFKVEANTIITK